LFRFAEPLSKIFPYGNFPTQDDYLLESNRNKGKEIVKKFYKDIEVAPVQEFKKIQDAIKFLENEDRLFCLKGNDDDCKTIVPQGKDIESNHSKIIESLNKDKMLYEKSGFILEQKIVDPIEITPQAVFFNGKLVFMDVDIENKPIGAENTSYQVGCAQNLVIPLNPNSQLAKIAFSDFVFQLAKKRKGIFVWDASILIDPKTGKKYFGEFCSNRFGWDSFYTESAMSRSLHGYLEDITNLKNPLISDFGVAVRMFNINAKPPYFYHNDDLKDKEISVKRGVNNWLFDCYLDKDIMKTTGYTMDLAVATGYGKTIEQATNMAYEESESVIFDDKYMRTKNDFLGTYPTSIVNRYNYIKKLL
jgi:hypothetical protein